MARQVLQLATDTSDISELQEDKEAPWVLEQTGRSGHPQQPLPVGNKGARAFSSSANQRGTTSQWC